MADDTTVQVKFSAETSELTAAIQKSGLDLKNFSADCLALNPQLAALAGAMDGAANKIDKAADGNKKLKDSTAGVTREFLVLGHEALTGNFKRMAGSSLVLANRMNLLKGIVSKITPAIAGWAAVIGTAAYATYEMSQANERLIQTLYDAKAAMDFHSQGLSFNAAQMVQQITSLRVWGDLSEESAEKVLMSFASVGNMSSELKSKLVSMVADYAAATQKEAPKAAEDLIKMFSDPVKAARDLGAQNILTASQVEAVTTAFRDGKDEAAAQKVLLDDLGSKLDDFRLNHVSLLSKELDKLHGAWVELSTFWLISDVPKLPQLPAGQQAQAQSQDHSNELNQAQLQGLDVEKQSGLLIARSNELLGRKAALIRAANAAGEQGNDSGQKRFLADAQEVQQQIDALRTKSQKQDVSAEMQAVQTKLEVDKIGLGQKKDILEAEVDLGIISKTKEIAALKQFTDEEYALDLQAKNDELNLDNLSVVEKQRIYDDILKLKAQHNRDMAALDLQLAAAGKKAKDEEIQSYRQVFDQIGGKFDTIINGVLQGTQTWTQATRRAAGDVVLVMAEAAAKVSAEWAGSKIFGALGWTEMASAVAPKGGGLLGAITGTGASATQDAAQTANTAAITALNAHMLALNAALGVSSTATSAHTVATTGNTAATVTGTAVTGTGTVATTASTVATTANTATTASTGLLHVAAMAENTIATIANTISTDLLRFVEGVKSLLGFDVGTWSVPSTGAALIHQGEIILPPGVSSAVRAGTMQVGSVGGQGGQGGGDNYQVSVNVSAIDTQSGAAFLKQNAGVIAQTLVSQMRGGNQSLRPR